MKEEDYRRTYKEMEALRNVELVEICEEMNRSLGRHGESSRCVQAVSAAY